MSVCSSNPPGFWLVSYSDIRIPHCSLMAGTNWASYLHISLPLLIMSWWYAGRIIVESLSANERVEWSPAGQSEARWLWWVRGWPVVTSVVTIIRSPNMGHGRLMNVGCHTVIDMARAGFFKSPPTNTLYCYPLDIVCIFPPRLTIQIDFVLASWDLWVVLMSGCLAVWWGNENGLCDIQSDKNMDFWKMKYETAHYATG